MAITLNKDAVKRAEYLIKAGEVESFDADWNEEQPTPDEVNYFIDHHFMEEYGLWFLGKNSNYPDSVKEHYEYPYGDLKEVQQCALVYTLARAEENGDHEIAQVAKKLLDMIE
jgi:hypothetical protein